MAPGRIPQGEREGDYSVKRISGVQIVINFIGKHPGCTFPEIRTETGLDQSVVNSAIWAMVNDGRARRTGEYRHYKYTLATRTAVTDDEPAASGCHDPDRCNPLTHMFNQRLAAVRAVYGRMG